MTGLTHADMAKNLGIGVTTFQDYVKAYPLFAAAIKEADSVTDEIVESALFQRATGYEHDDTDIRVCDKEIIMTPIIKKYPPDTTAAIFWLKNRRPDIWRDKQDIEHSGNISDPVKDKIAKELGELDTEALLKIAFGD